jgi:fructose/tagatose bisphosphate aldolase
MVEAEQPDDLREAIPINVVKVNVGADVFRAWMTGIQEGGQLATGTVTNLLIIS